MTTYWNMRRQCLVLTCLREAYKGGNMDHIRDMLLETYHKRCLR